MIGVFLHDIYSKELVMNSDIQTEIIWSDGPSSGFKNAAIDKTCLFSIRKNLFGSFLELSMVKVSWMVLVVMSNHI